MNSPSPSTRSDYHLVASLRAGSEKAFRVLFDRYHRKIYWAGVRMGLSKEDAEGIVQEVFLLVWEKRLTLRPNCSFNAFLLTLTQRRVIKQVRHQVVVRKHVQRACHQQPAQDTVTQDAIVARDLEAYALDYVEAMPPARQEIFRLSRQEGLDNDEIARKLKLSKRTVENQLYRAIKSIRIHLKRGNDLPPAGIGILLLYLLAW